MDLIDIEQRKREFRVTLKSSITFVGRGIHSALKSKITLHPYDKGIFFKKDKKYFKLSPFKIVNTLGSTDLTVVKTIEHLLAALFFNKVDSVLIEVFGSEIPILDGSIYYFNKALEDNFFILDKKSRVIKINNINLQKFNLHLNYQVLSSDIFKVYCIQRDLKSNRYFIAYYDENMKIYPAKTFGYLSDYEVLKQLGLGKGANYNNTLILSLNKIQDFFYFPMEIAYHKLIDFCGDIFTTQIKNLKATFILFNPNHYLNNQLAKIIFKSILNKKSEIYNKEDKNI